MRAYRFSFGAGNWWVVIFACAAPAANLVASSCASFINFPENEMLSISNGQLRSLDLDCYEGYISHLLLVMERPCFEKGLSAALQRSDKAKTPRDLALLLVKQANDYGFVAEGDVTPFCLMSICVYSEFQIHGSIDWIKAIVVNTEIDPALRMDAVFAMINATARDLIFSQ